MSTLGEQPQKKTIVGLRIKRSSVGARRTKSTGRGKVGPEEHSAANVRTDSRRAGRVRVSWSDPDRYKALGLDRENRSRGLIPSVEVEFPEELRSSFAFIGTFASKVVKPLRRFLARSQHDRAHPSQRARSRRLEVGRVRPNDAEDGRAVHLF